MDQPANIRPSYFSLFSKKTWVFLTFIIVGAAIFLSMLLSSDDTMTSQTKTNPTIDDALAHIPGGWLTVIVQKGSSLASIFAEKKLPQTQLSSIVKLPEAKYFEKLSPGEKVHLLVTPNNQVAMLAYALDPRRTLVVKNNPGNGFEAELEKPKLQTKLTFADVLIHNSLSVDREKAGLSSALSIQLSDIFSGKLDMRKVHPGDHFMVLYNTLERDGKKVKDGSILAAKFVSKNGSKMLQAFLFTDASHRTGYYSLDGSNMRSSIWRKPVKGGRISSPFYSRRFHPILHKYRAHLGVDYAVPYGTPIMAAGDGKVVFRGRKGGYGNIVIINHGHGYTTRYAHMSRFAKNLKLGSIVHQGQTIGYVGTTGYATGPHVHFEIRVKGVAKDPLKVALPSVNTIPVKQKPEFVENAKRLLAKMESIEKTQANAADVL